MLMYTQVRAPPGEVVFMILRGGTAAVQRQLFLSRATKKVDPEMEMFDLNEDRAAAVDKTQKGKCKIYLLHTPLILTLTLTLTHISS